ncbi:hypothetical protein D3C80_1516600 [compost metagenome]
MKKIGTRLGISNFELFIVMVTSRSYDKSDFAMSGDVSSEEIRRLKQYGQDNFFAMTQILSGVDRKLLLLLKNNELLRAIQMDLGIPVNYFVTFAEYAMRGINMDRLEKNPGLWTRLMCMKDYFSLKLKLFIAARAPWLVPLLQRSPSGSTLRRQAFATN